MFLKQEKVEMDDFERKKYLEKCQYFKYKEKVSAIWIRSSVL